MEKNQEIERLKTEAQIKLQELEAHAPAKETAGKAIGKHGLVYITIILAMGVGASIVLDEAKMAAVMGLLGASLTALISMINGIAGATPKQDKPEFAVMTQLIDKLDKLDREEQPMRVDVVGDKVTVTKGADKISAARE
jgi:hypothetical protein